MDSGPEAATVSAPISRSCASESRPATREGRVPSGSGEPVRFSRTIGRISSIRRKRSDFCFVLSARRALSIEGSAAGVSASGSSAPSRRITSPRRFIRLLSACSRALSKRPLRRSSSNTCCAQANMASRLSPSGEPERSMPSSCALTTSRSCPAIVARATTAPLSP